jgi:hypothetical protein
MTSSTVRATNEVFAWDADNVKTAQYIDGHCMFSALLNQRRAYAHVVGLKLVVGSLGIGAAKDAALQVDMKDGSGKTARFRIKRGVHWEYGAPNATRFEQFISAVGIDAHAWLEDAQGNVYDRPGPRLYDLVHAFKRTTTFADTSVYEGVPKATLQRLGLHYAAAPGAVQQALLRRYATRSPAAFLLATDKDLRLGTHGNDKAVLSLRQELTTKVSS